MQCIHRALQIAPWSYHRRWFFMCKWEGLSFFKLLHYIPFCWKTNTGNQPTLIKLQEGARFHSQDCRLQSQGLKAQCILHDGTQSLSLVGASWLLWDCSLGNLFWEYLDFECNPSQQMCWRENCFRAKNYEELNGWFTKWEITWHGVLVETPPCPETCFCVERKFEVSWDEKQ